MRGHQLGRNLDRQPRLPDPPGPVSVTEEARVRIAAWEHERDTLTQSVFARAGPELECGLASGRRLSLEEAVRKTLGT